MGSESQQRAHGKRPLVDIGNEKEKEKCVSIGIVTVIVRVSHVFELSHELTWNVTT